MSSPIIFGPNGATSLVSGGVTLPGSTSGTIQIQPAAATTSYAVKMPAAQGAASTTLLNDGAGNLSWSSGGGTQAAPTTQTFLTGSGTYTAPANVKYIKVTMAGGGGGGSGAALTGPQGGGTGGTSTFGSSLLIATGGGSGDSTQGQTGGLGGTVTVNSPAVSILALNGGAGCGPAVELSLATSVGTVGGSGGTNPLGGAGGTAATGLSTLGVAPNTGAGGPGGGAGATSNVYLGSGGGAGGFIQAYIYSPSSTYSYAVGAAGTAGTAGTGGIAGGAGAAGIIVVEEFYNIVSGSLSVNPSVVTVITSTATLTTANNYVIVNYSSGTCNITIPGGVASGTIFNIKTVTAQNVIVTPTSGTVDGSSTLTISGQYTSANIVSDGTNYWVV